MKLLLIDLSYSLHRCLRQPNLWELKIIGRNENDVPIDIRTGGIYGVFNSLYKVMKDFPGYYPVFCSDKGLSKRRLELQPNYKHSLDRLEEQKKPEFELTEEEIKAKKESEEYRDAYRYSKREIKKISEKLGIPYIEIEGYEGDDILASLTLMDNITDVVVVTDDMDLYQLMGLRTDINITNYRALADQIITQSQFFEEWKSIDNFVLHKSICGDGSDNIPQIATKVGGATALKMIEIWRNKGFDNNAITAECELLSGDYYGGEVWTGRGKNKTLERDDTPKLSNPAVQALLEMGNKVAPRNMIKALCEGQQLKSNLEMIDLRYIEDEIKQNCISSFKEQIDKYKGTKTSIFEAVSLFSSYRIKDLAISDIVSAMNNVKERLV